MSSLPPIPNAPLHTRWYYADASNQTHGPVSFDELQRLAKTGEITSETLVFEEGATEWRRFAEVPPPLPQGVRQVTSPNGFLGCAGVFFGVLLCLSGMGALVGVPLIVWTLYRIGKAQKTNSSRPGQKVAGKEECSPTGSKKSPQGCLKVFLVFAFLLLALIVVGSFLPKPQDSSVQTVAETPAPLSHSGVLLYKPAQAPVAPVPPPSAVVKLPKFEIISANDTPSFDKIVYTVHVGYCEGKIPTREQVAEIGKRIHSTAQNRGKVHIMFYLPDMFVGAGAFATNHFTPELSETYSPDFIFSNWLSGFHARYGRSFQDDAVVKSLYDEYDVKFIRGRGTLSNHEEFMKGLYDRLEQRVKEIK